MDQSTPNKDTYFKCGYIGYISRDFPKRTTFLTNEEPPTPMKLNLEPKSETFGFPKNVM